MVFTEEDKFAIKFLRQTKNYCAKRLMLEFPNKTWKLEGLKALIRKIDATGSIERICQAVAYTSQGLHRVRRGTV